MVVRAKATAIMSMNKHVMMITLVAIGGAAVTALVVQAYVLRQGWGMEAVLIIMVLLLLFRRRRRREEPRVTIINYIYVNSSKPSLPY
jgi:hypothetical protein